MTLTALQQTIWNNGERLIPGVTHDPLEVKLHHASYLHWRDMIESDGDLDGVTILDLGCGVGHGSYLLAELPGVQVVGVDHSQAAIDYAKAHYAAPNIYYICDDLHEYLDARFDYVVSRGVLEHLDDGMRVIERMKFRRRFMFNVPYREPAERNPHHVWCEIEPEDFAHLDCEIYYEHLDCKIMPTPHKGAILLMVMM